MKIINCGADDVADQTPQPCRRQQEDVVSIDRRESFDIISETVSRCRYLSPPKEGGYVFTPVCLFVRPLDYSESYERILMILIRTQEFFQVFFIRYCDSYRQPRIKRENPQLRFELSTI